MVGGAGDRGYQELEIKGDGGRRGCGYQRTPTGIPCGDDIALHLDDGGYTNLHL